MSYEIEWSSQSLKVIKKLSTKDAERILKKLDDVAFNPFRYLKHFEGDSLYKLRIGDYRALLEIDNEEKIIFIQVLDKRGRIYKK